MYRKPQWSTIAKLIKATEQRRTIVRHSSDSSIITHWAVRFHVHRSRSEEEKGGSEWSLENNTAVRKIAQKNETGNV